jgi:type VI secretion system protein ImpE
MSPLLTLRDGSLAETLAELQARVRNEPAEAKHRTFLFELLSVLGQWDRALTQLEVAGELSAATLGMVQVYRQALGCEVLRGEVFAGKRSPLVFGQPEQWVALLIEALRLTADGKHAQAGELRGAALEAAAATSGSLRPGAHDAAPQAFEWIADADPRLGPVLEAIVNGRYFWIPFCNIKAIQVEKPADLRDLVWMPAQFQWANGGEAVGLIPTRYAGSETSEDDGIRLARKTDWVEHATQAFAGLGQRMLATDAGEYALMDIRRIDLDAVAADQGGAPASGAPASHG